MFNDLLNIVFFSFNIILDAATIFCFFVFYCTTFQSLSKLSIPILLKKFWKKIIDNVLIF